MMRVGRIIVLALTVITSLLLSCADDPGQTSTDQDSPTSRILSFDVPFAVCPTRRPSLSVRVGELKGLFDSDHYCTMAIYEYSGKGARNLVACHSLPFQAPGFLVFNDSYLPSGHYCCIAMVGSSSSCDPYLAYDTTDWRDLHIGDEICEYWRTLHVDYYRQHGRDALPLGLQRIQSHFDPASVSVGLYAVTGELASMPIKYDSLYQYMLANADGSLGYSRHLFAVDGALRNDGQVMDEVGGVTMSPRPPWVDTVSFICVRTCRRMYYCAGMADADVAVSFVTLHELGHLCCWLSDACDSAHLHVTGACAMFYVELDQQCEYRLSCADQSQTWPMYEEFCDSCVDRLRNTAF